MHSWSIKMSLWTLTSLHRSIWHCLHILLITLIWTLNPVSFFWFLKICLLWSDTLCHAEVFLSDSLDLSDVHSSVNCWNTKYTVSFTVLECSFVFIGWILITQVHFSDVSKRTTSLRLSADTSPETERRRATDRWEWDVVKCQWSFQKEEKRWRQMERWSGQASLKDMMECKKNRWKSGDEEGVEKSWWLN